MLNYHIGRFVLGLLCVGVWVRFCWGGIRDAGFSWQPGYSREQNIEFLYVKQIATYVYVPLHSEMLTYKTLSSAQRVHFFI